MSACFIVVSTPRIALEWPARQKPFISTCLHTLDVPCPLSRPRLHELSPLSYPIFHNNVAGVRQMDGEGWLSSNELKMSCCFSIGDVHCVTE